MEGFLRPGEDQREAAGDAPPPPPPPPQERSSRSLKPIYGGKGRGQAGGELAGAGLAEGWAATGLSPVVTSRFVEGSLGRRDHPSPQQGVAGEKQVGGGLGCVEKLLILGVLPWRWDV